MNDSEPAEFKGRNYTLMPDTALCGIEGEDLQLCDKDYSDHGYAQSSSQPRSLTLIQASICHQHICLE